MNKSDDKKDLKNNKKNSKKKENSNKEKTSKNKNSEKKFEKQKTEIREIKTQKKNIKFINNNEFVEENPNLEIVATSLQPISRNSDFENSSQKITSLEQNLSEQTSITNENKQVNNQYLINAPSDDIYKREKEQLNEFDFLVKKAEKIQPSLISDTSFNTRNFQINPELQELRQSSERGNSDYVIKTEKKEDKTRLPFESEEKRKYIS